MSWVAEAAEIWQARFDGTIAHGRLGKALKATVNKHGWETVKVAWAAYLTEYDPDFATPENFVSKYGLWSGSVRRPTAEAKAGLQSYPGEQKCPHKIKPELCTVCTPEVSA